LHRNPIRIEKPHPGPEALAEVLAQLFVARGWGKRTERSALEDAVKTAIKATAGETMLPLVSPGKLFKGTLELWVKGSAALSELSGFHQSALLTALQAAHPVPEIKKSALQESRRCPCTQTSRTKKARLAQLLYCQSR